MTTLSTALNVISTLALMGAVIFAGLQVRTSNRIRAEQAAITIVTIVQNDSWIRALDLLFRIPCGASAVEIDELGPEMPRVIREIGVRLETIGYMVWAGIVSLETIDRLIGSVTVAWWLRVKPWVERERDRTARPRHYEWFQWLAERLEGRRPHGEDQPAYLRYARQK